MNRQVRSMQYRKLGRTGLDVSVISLGSGGPNQFGQVRFVPRESIHELVGRALRSGINYFDTASGYGNSEGLLGEALRGVPRDHYLLSSKIYPLHQNSIIDVAEFRRRAEQSLARLRVETLDMLFFHKVPPERYQETVDRLLPTLLELRAEGKVRHIGISESTHRDPQHTMLKRALQDDLFDIIMLGYHVANRSAELEVLPLAMEKGVGAIGMSPARHLVYRSLRERLRLLNRVLHARPRSSPAQSRLKERLWVLRSALRKTAARQPVSIAREGGEGSLTLPAAGYTFAISHPAVTTILTGTTNGLHLEQNIEAVLAPAVTPREAELLASFFQ